MKTVNLVITGVSPILINRFKEQDEVVEAVKKSTKKDYGTPRAQAEATAYRDDKSKKIWIPTTWITGAIKTVASDYKLPSSRKSVKSVSGGCIIPADEKAYFKENYKVKDVEVDSRPVVIQRARIMRHRARLEKWSVETTLEIDETIIPVSDVHAILIDAGKRAGMGDFRPQKGGPFGRFHITSWKVQGEKKVKKVTKKKATKKKK
jgi:hypothetical protein